MIDKVGTTKRAHDTIDVYSLTYKTIPEDAGMAVHGGQRIILLVNDNKYLGQIVIPTPPFRKLQIKDNALIFSPGISEGAIKLDQDPLPESFTIDGDEAEVFK
jgi:hypothetical protein